jgi:hydroxypyruvate reductase/glycerate 2-kinase
VRPEKLLRTAFADSSSGLIREIESCRRILVVGGGKAGAAMSLAVEELLSQHLDRVTGWVNVPAEVVRPLQRIHLHAARPQGTNQPTAEGVAGAERILEMVHSAEPGDVMICLLSGGGSALLPAPVEGITLEDKQRTTLALHACGATINEMNAVRKHLSRIKGGRLAEAFTGRAIYSLIISDVVGDPLDVIASGPTAPDPSTFSYALGVLQRFRLLPVRDDVSQGPAKVSSAVVRYLQRGLAGEIPETPKSLPSTVHYRIVGSNADSLAAASTAAERLGYRVVNLGSSIEGPTGQVAADHAQLMRRLRHGGRPLLPPVCILSGGETTVALGPDHGTGGRNQEFVLTFVTEHETIGLKNAVVLSGGTDGEDGPTDAAGAVADQGTIARSKRLALDPGQFLIRHDSYNFFSKTGDLLKPGLTQTNVMDVRIILLR